MHAGQLRHRAEFQQFSRTANEFGEEELTWHTYYACNVSLTPTGQIEIMSGGTITPRTSYQVGMRYRDGVKSKDRIKIGSRLFNIESVINTENRMRELTLVATEEDSNGEKNSSLR